MTQKKKKKEVLIDSPLVKNHEFSFHSSLSLSLENEKASIRYLDPGAEIEGGSRPAEGRRQRPGGGDEIN